jgi:hypothetical protein
MIFVLSLHRSGTQSVHSFLKQAGYNAIHNPSGRSEMDFQSEWVGHEQDLEYIFSNLINHSLPKYNAISDNPMAALYKQAYESFPEAKFILMVRDCDKWVASVRKHIGDRNFVPAEKVQYWKYLDFEPNKLDEIDDLALHTLYEKHHKETIDFFEKNRILNQLCVIDLEKSSGLNGVILSDFLHVSPHIPLPWIDNKGEKRDK